MKITDAEHISIFGKPYCFTEEQWVVSIFTVPCGNSSTYVNGHSAILLEGMRDGRRFIGQYDILPASCAEFQISGSYMAFFTSKINVKGYINQVRVFEGENYFFGYDYKNFFHNSGIISSENSKFLIKKIKQDQNLVHRFLTLLADKEDKAKREQGIVSLLSKPEFESIRFQQHGEHGLLSSENAGVNCQQWCHDTVKNTSGIELGGKKKPKGVMCVIC